jgi:Lon-like ATP-dependent protease
MFNRQCRAALQSSQRLYATSRYHVATSANYSTIPRRIPSTPLSLRHSSLAASRSLSTTSARRKDDSAKKVDPEEEAQDQENKDNKDRKDSLEPVKEESIAKEPTSIPDGRGASSAGGDGAPAGGDSGSGGSGRKRKGGEKGLVKPSVPDVYPQVLAIPIAQRPLFPGFYKAITIRDPNVIAAVQELLKRGQSYVGAFLLKDPESNTDVINDPSEVYDVGTFSTPTAESSSPS